ncbi:putative all-trans-retinol 13,14-reductase [Astyanax mexicanus]|uniref:Putative all-trans-retinol 13,14-reductase n=1 Tax=Astyanax mexicanus TaxID=7994 RepID=A0A8B9JV69_ASTMX|nr:putative all-trans-retinol 13,14-reductase [Astyanax mexicanus]
MMWFLLFLEWFVDWARGTYWYLFGKRSPLCRETFSPPAQENYSQEARDKVLAQEFSQSKVPSNLDVVVIGSGVGGLTVAAVLVKLGKKVLVLDQHERAGGFCQSFTEKGFQFDMAFHYIGQLHENGLLKIAFDQITDGQLQFAELDPHSDTVVIEKADGCKEYTIYTGKRQMEAHLKKQFPSETRAIEEFFKIMKVCSKKIHLLCDLKLVPLWFARFILCSGIADWISPVFKYSRTSTTEMISSLTNNKDLLTVLSHYLHGVPPSNASCMINALLFHHYKRGAYYPKGGAGEIPYRIIQTIEKHGGKVLVKAPVSQILVNDAGAAYGVTVKKGGEQISIKAPVVISSTSVFTTFQTLLPPEIITKPEMKNCLHGLKLSKASFQVFAGFDATQEELGITSTNMWLFKSNDLDDMLEVYYRLNKEEAPEKIPMMFISFPSAKDPSWKQRFPGKSCMVIHTLVKYEWFEQWKDLPVGQDQYEHYKMRFTNQLFDWSCVRFPKLKAKLSVLHAVGPINAHGMGAPAGSILSAEHNLDRYKPLNIAKIRCSTPIKNLYLSGQDVFSTGYSGALHGGLLCASTVLGQVVYTDLLLLQKRLKQKAAKKLD